MPTAATVAALLDQAPDTELVDVIGSETAYFELFVGLWHDAEDFLLLEHDVVLAPGAVDVLRECPELWCECSPSLRCSRWRAELMRAYPTLPLEISPPERHWLWLDVGLHCALKRRGLRPHSHEQLATHEPSPVGRDNRSDRFAEWLAHPPSWSRDRWVVPDTSVPAQCDQCGGSENVTPVHLEGWIGDEYHRRTVKRCLDCHGCIALPLGGYGPPPSHQRQPVAAP